MQDDLRAGDTGVSTFDAHALDRVVGRAQTRRIDKPVENAVEVQRGFDRIACRAGNFGYQRPLLVKQTVEQRAFPDVGAADDCDGDTLLDGVAQGEGVDQPVDLRTDPLHCSAEFRAVGEFDLFLAEIEFEFEQRGEPQQLAAQRFQLGGVTAAHLVGGQCMCRTRTRSDQVGDRFGLRQVELAAEKGARSEFAGRCHAGAAANQQCEQFADDVPRAVTRDLDRIFAGVGVRRTENRDQHVVEHACAVGDRAVEHRVAGCFARPPCAAEYGVADRECRGTAHAHDGDRAACGSGGRDDGIVRGVHRRRIFSFWPILRRLALRIRLSRMIVCCETRYLRAM